MKKVLLILTILQISFKTNSQINSYPYVETGDLPIGWNVIQTTPIWNFGTAIVNPAGKPNDAAVLCNFFAYASGPVGIVTSPLFNFTSLTNPVVHFYSAYTSYDIQNDSLQFLVSTDAGNTFIDVPAPFRRSFNSTPSLATVPSQHTQYVPSAVNQWRHETINMAAYAGRNNIMFGLRGVCDYGNNLWIDNFVVNDADNFCQMNITSPGNYICSNTTVTFNSIGINQEFQQDENPSGGVLSFVQHTFESTVPSLANPKIGLNSTAITNDGSVFTPNKVSPDLWLTVSYSGNDIRGYANYNIEIDITSITGIVNPDKLYILKRADITGSWMCLNTSRTGTKLFSNGLTTFSDFAIAGDSLVNPLPVEITAFESEVNGRNVIISWSTAGEINNSGFDVERKEKNSNWIKAGFVKGNGNSNTVINYLFEDRNVKSGKYNYRLKQIDFNGNYEFHELPEEVVIESERNFRLMQNYPNPFNPVTAIEFNIPFNSFVRIDVYDISGKKIETLADSFFDGGYHSAVFDGSNLSSGIYIYRISIFNDKIQIQDEKKMLLLK